MQISFKRISVSSRFFRSTFIVNNSNHVRLSSEHVIMCSSVAMLWDIRTDSISFHVFTTSNAAMASNLILLTWVIYVYWLIANLSNRIFYYMFIDWLLTFPIVSFITPRHTFTLFIYSEAYKITRFPLALSYNKSLIVRLVIFLIYISFLFIYFI